MVFRSGLGLDCHVRHSLLTMYARCGELGCARKRFGVVPMISSYSKMGFAKEAVELFGRMKGEGLEANEMGLVTVLGECGSLGDLGLGSWIEEFVLESKMEVNSYIGSALINMYGKCGDLLSARRVFDGMVNKPVVAWNAIIAGYAQNGLSDEAISLFDAMKEAGQDPNEITLVEVLSACASIGALDLGKLGHAMALGSGLGLDCHVKHSLITMYARCGELGCTGEVLDEISGRNLVLWNSMISGYLKMGLAKEVVVLFGSMRGERFEVNKRV
ncbi:hypothetical protein RJ639_014449, partial [Escallonia herrerae]